MNDDSIFLSTKSAFDDSVCDLKVKAVPVEDVADKKKLYRNRNN